MARRNHAWELTKKDSSTKTYSVSAVNSCNNFRFPVSELE